MVICANPGWYALVSNRHACKPGFEGIVSKRLGSPYVSGRSRHWIKNKNPQHPAVKREAEEDWGGGRWR
jgi:ATP-dependent DNA ligase